MTKQEEKVIKTLTKLKKEFFTAYHLIEAVKRFGLFDGMAYSTKTGRWKYIPRDENGTMNPTYPMCYWNYYPWFVIRRIYIGSDFIPDDEEVELLRLEKPSEENADWTNMFSEEKWDELCYSIDKKLKQIYKDEQWKTNMI